MNCDSKDDAISKENGKKSPIEYISLSNFNSNVNTSEISEKLKLNFDINKKNNQLMQSKGVSNSDLIIITDEIIKIAKNDTIYYTFKTFTPLAKNNEFYNLIVYVNNQHDIFNIELLRYTPEIDWLSDITRPYKGTVAKIEHEISMRSAITTNYLFSGTGGCISSVSVNWLCNFHKAHAPGEGENCSSWTATITLNFGPCPNANEEEVDVLVDIPSEGGVGGGATLNGTPTVPVPPCKEVVGSQTIGITDGSGGCLDNIVPFDKALLKLTAEMTNEQTMYWNNFTYSEREEILNYINNQTNINAAVDFAIQFIEQSRLNPTLNLDFETSTKSPANIDLDAINNNTPEGQKFIEIYDELANVPEFKAIFIDVFNSDGTRPNVKFVIEEHVYSLDNPNNAEVNATTNGTNPNFYLIKINKQCLLPNTTKSQADIEIAKTIVHEAMHAYLYFNINNPVFANISMPDLLDEIKNIDANQHNFIFTNLAPKLGAILSELKDVLTTPTQRTIVENMPIYAVQNPQSVPITWNWNTYFTYLSYQGLEESEGFKALFPLGSNALYIYTQYMAIGHYNL